MRKIASAVVASFEDGTTTISFMRSSPRGTKVLFSSVPVVTQGKLASDVTAEIARACGEVLPIPRVRV